MASTERMERVSMVTEPSAMPDASVGLRCTRVAASPWSPLTCDGESRRIAAAVLGAAAAARGSTGASAERASITPAASGGEERAPAERALDNRQWRTPRHRTMPAKTAPLHGLLS